MDLSIIILNYKSRELVKQCIKTIKLYEPALQYEIIVVDSASCDGVESMLQERHPEVKCIVSPVNGGYARGNNLGIAASSGRYVMIMNPDITVRPGAIEEMVKYMDEHRDVGVIGPRLVHPDGSFDESCFRYPDMMTPVYRRTPLGQLSFGKKAVDRYVMADYDRQESRDVDWLLGAVLLIRRSALSQVGPLDERYFLYFEDTDWCRRFKQKGYRVVYYTGAEMVHYHDRMSAQAHWLVAPFTRGAWIHIESAVKYFVKWR